MKTFRCYQLAKSFYCDTRSLRLKGAIRDQFERAALSIVLNLSEGSAKPTVKDRKRFYFIAFASLREVQAMLELLNEKKFAEQADVLAAHIYRLCHH